MNKKLFVILLALLVLSAGLLAAVHPLSRQLKKADRVEDTILEEASVQDMREEVEVREAPEFMEEALDRELPDEEILDEEGLPLDTGAGTASASTDAASLDTGAEEETEPNIDPDTGMEREEDELPILTP